MSPKMYVLSAVVLCFLYSYADGLADESNNTLVAGLPASFSLHSRIVGGVTTKIEEHPYQAAVDIYTKDGRFICGGSIISKYWILTAAHCVYDRPTKVIVRVGSTYFGSGTAINVDRLVIHPFYNSLNTDRDVALLLLEEPLELNGKTIDSISLADTEPLPDTPVTITGWGTTAEEGNTSDVLMEVTLPTVNRELCNRQYDFRITHNMLCAGFLKGGKDSCQGDSGGPAVTDDNVLVGVVSFGEGCARPGYPGVYSNVAAPAIRHWIYSITGV